ASALRPQRGIQSRSAVSASAPKQEKGGADRSTLRRRAWGVGAARAASRKPSLADVGLDGAHHLFTGPFELEKRFPTGLQPRPEGPDTAVSLRAASRLALVQRAFAHALQKADRLRRGGAMAGGAGPVHAGPAEPLG